MKRVKIAFATVAAACSLLVTAACGPQQNIVVLATCAGIPGKPGLAWTLNLSNDGPGGTGTIVIQFDGKTVNNVILAGSGPKSSFTQGPTQLRPSDMHHVTVVHMGMSFYDQKWSGSNCPTPALPTAGSSRPQS